MSPHLRTARATAAIALAALSVAALAACSDDPTPAIEIGDLPQDVGPAIDLDVPLNDYGTFTEWPDACELVTDETIQALLPQAEEITRAPDSQTFEFHAPDLTSIPGGTMTVQNAICDTDIAIPIGMLEDSGYPASIHTEVLMAGSEQIVEANEDPSIDDEGATPLEIDGGTCSDTVFGISCVNATGQVAVRISLTFPHHGPSLKDPTRYVHDGEEVTFLSSDDEAGRTAYINEHLAYPIVSSVLARLSG